MCKELLLWAFLIYLRPTKLKGAYNIIIKKFENFIIS